MSRSLPPSGRVFVVGSTGTGKTTLLRELWAKKAARLLVLDATGEWAGPGWAEAFGLAQVADKLARAAFAPSWRLAAALDLEELPALAELLVPRHRPREGFAGSVGGLTLLLDECDLAAPHGCGPEVRGLWQRGRHAGLSILAATQRPTGCHPVVRSQSRYLASSRLVEPAEVRYLERVMPLDAARAVPTLARGEAVIFDSWESTAWHLSARRVVVKTWQSSSRRA